MWSRFGLGLMGLMKAGAVSGPDVASPTVSAFSPLDDATDIAIDATLTATFNETVVLGASGVITLKLTSDDSTIDSWDVAADEGSGAGQVEVVGGTVLTLHLTTDLDNSEEFYVIWDAGVVEDGSANAVAALVTTTTWSFTTIAGAAPTFRQFMVAPGVYANTTIGGRQFMAVPGVYINE